MSCWGVSLVALSTRRLEKRKGEKKKSSIDKTFGTYAGTRQRIFCLLANFMIVLKIAAIPLTMPKVHR